MTHLFIIGLSQTGKSTLAKQLAHGAKQKGYGVIVCDPMNARDWIADYQTDDLDEFAEVYQDSRMCYAFIDECFLLDTHHHRKMLAKMNAAGRHYGIRNVMIGQRYTAVPKTARELAERKLIFRQSPDDAREIHGQYPHEAVKNLPSLGVGEYLDLTTFNCVLRKTF